MGRFSASVVIGICLVVGAIAVGLFRPAPASAGSAHASIIGGTPASIAEYPWLAFIEAETGQDEGFECTGTVVAPRIVLTAGHCVEDIESGQLTPAADFAVATGVSDLTTVPAANISRVSQAVVDPAFRPSLLRNDAGLLVLATPTTAPALGMASASDSSLLAAGTPLSIAGWGLTDPNAKDITGDLLAASTIVQSTSYCRNKVAQYYPFYSSATQLCAIDPPGYSSGSCHGDSGGPAIARSNGVPVQVGIISLGESKCATRLPDVFTRVDRVSSWVAAWIAAVEAGGPTPTVTTPKAQLPLLTIPRAKYFVARGLGEDFRFRYRRGSSKQTSCSRVEREKVKCHVWWYQGGNDYYGTITIYYVLGRESVLWNDRYTIHWVDDYCWFHSGHRDTCVIRTRRR